jgi:hypothetical protein
MDKKWIAYGVAFLAGVMLANRVRTLPVLKSLPSV